MKTVLTIVAIAVSVFYAGKAAVAEGLITAANWTEMVGFKPDLTTVPVTPGETINKGNLGKVAVMLPDGLKKMIGKYNLEMKLKSYEPVHPSLGYIEATNKYRGSTKLIDTGSEYRKRGFSGYVAGLPFPRPKSGLEVAWDYLYNYAGDDADYYYDVHWISASSGIEHSEYWRYAFIFRTVNRTDLDPRPAIDEYKKRGLQYTSITYAIEPYDKKGFGALYSRSIDPEDEQGHVYVPAMRRVLRNTFGTRGDTWNSTDLLYEDVRGYLGYAEWMYWKILGKKTMLLPVHSGNRFSKNAKDVFDIDKWPHWNPKFQWEPRPVYVVEAKPKFDGYPYSKMIMLVDAETFFMPYKEAYDKKGDLWKIVINSTNASPDMNSRPLDWAGTVVVDFQAEHATLITTRKYISNVGLDLKLFTLANLRSRSK